MMAKLVVEGKKDFDVEEVSNASLIKDDRYSNSPSSDQYYHKQQVPIYICSAAPPVDSQS